VSSRRALAILLPIHYRYHKMMVMAKLALLAVLGISTAFDRNDHGIHGEMIAVYAAPASGSPDDGSREHIIARYTPMAADGMSLDLGKVPAYAEFVAARNISNVMPAGSNGESLSLTVAEREALLEAWVAAAAPLKLNVYMHIGSESIVDSIELARHAGAVKGCRGIVSMTPVYFKPTVDSLIEFLAPVAAAAPELPFWSARRRFFPCPAGISDAARGRYYHFPDDTGVLPGAAHTFLEQADASGAIPTLMGIKFTARPPRRRSLREYPIVPS